MKKIKLLLPVILLISACNSNTGKPGEKKEVIPAEPAFPAITADFETTAVPDGEDAADDPAVYINPLDPSKSYIIGTNKQRGLEVYNLEGTRVSSLDVGRVNNVDLRHGFQIRTRPVDIVGASNRTDNSIVIAIISPEDGSLTRTDNGSMKSALDEVYGFCLYHDKQNGEYYAFVNGKSGGVEQWRLMYDDKGGIAGDMVRTFSAGSQTEGCVADDETGFLYIGEENKAVWKYYAHPDSSDSRTLVADLSNTNLKDDFEGITIYKKDNGQGYLIVSSQGNNSYAIFDRSGSNGYLGSFRITDGETVDGAEETDGIDVVSAPLGDAFPRGIFVVQDGFNYDDGKLVNQNFKIVSWEKIEEMIKAF